MSDAACDEAIRYPVPSGLVDDREALGIGPDVAAGGDRADRPATREAGVVGSVGSAPYFQIATSSSLM